MKKTIVLGLGVLLFWSCNNSEKKTVSETEENHTETQAEHHHNESSDALELNGGEKWIVNEEMKPFVSEQEALLNAYVQSNQSDNKALAEQLQAQNQLLIKSCTMTGKSHDELHKWLHPYMALLADLGQATTKEDADKLVSEVSTSFETYHAHFQ